MKPFEERYTAWVDGRMSDAERLAFEQELPDVGEAENDKGSLAQLGGLLRNDARETRLPSPDFFNHQLLQRIELEQHAKEPAKSRGWSWSIPQLAWAGAACLLTAVVLYQTTVPSPSATPANSLAQAKDDASYFAEIVDVRTDDPNVYASTVYTPSDNVTVLWLEGLDYLPASYALQN